MIRSALQVRDGGVGLLTALALIPITLMLLAAMNSGQASHERRALQDSADAIVLSHQRWAARSLNTLAMNQVASTQVISVAIGAEALDDTLGILRGYSWGAIGWITKHALRECPKFRFLPAVIVCAIQHGIETREAVSALRYVSRTRSKYQLSNVIAFAHQALRTLDDLNHEIIERFPRAMQDMAQGHADRSGLEDWYFVHGCQAPGTRSCETQPTRGGKGLPVIAEGVFERCQALNFGTLNGRTGFSSRGFPIGSGPLRYGGSEQTPDLKDHINKESEIGERLESFYEHYDKSEVIKFIGWDDFPRWLNLPFRQRKDGPNIFTVQFWTKRADVCAGGFIPSVPFVGGGLRAPLPTPWSAINIGPLERLTLKRPEHMPDDYHTLVAVTDQRGKRFGLAMFGPAPQRGYAYGQSAILNHISADFYTAAWRGDLMPSSELDDPSVIAQDIEARAASVFQEFADLLNAVDGAQRWDWINAH